MESRPSKPPRVLDGSVLGTIRSSSSLRGGSEMSSRQPPVVEAQMLLSDLVIGESPRWHENRLWFANWGAGEIVAVDLEGNAEVVAKGPPGLGWSIDWLARRSPARDRPRTPARGARRLDGQSRRPERPGRRRLQRDRRRRPRQHLRQRRLSTSTPVKGTPRASSPWSPPMAPYAEWPTGSRSPTAWPSRPTTRR